MVDLTPPLATAAALIDVGSTYDKLGSPMLQHLERMGEKWLDARLLADSMLPKCRHISVQQHLNQQHLLRGHLASIIDISIENDVSESARLNLAGNSQNASHINDFLGNLKIYGDRVHTRIVLLLNDSNDEVGDVEESTKSLLYIHIGGIGLDMTPSEIIETLVDEGRSRILFPSRRIVTYHDTELGTSMSCSFIGPQTHIPGQPFLGQSLPTQVTRANMGLVLLVFPKSSSLLSSKVFRPIPGLMETPRYSQPSSFPFLGASNSANDMLSCLAEFIKMWPTPLSRLVPGEPTAHWLGAIVYFAHDASKVTFRFAEGAAEQRLRSHLAYSRDLHRMLNQTRAILDDHPGIPRKELFWIMKLLEDSADTHVETAQELEREINLRVGSRSIEMAEISIAESRSTIALTVLAFAFVPISLAASIFGMNVQEINSSGHNIWVFVVTAVLMVLVSAFSWLLYRALRNRHVLRRHALGVIDDRFPAANPVADVELEPSSTTVRAVVASELRATVPSLWKLFSYRLGLRSIEKTAIGRRGNI